jgi:opacity protein-like surface antigen
MLFYKKISSVICLLLIAGSCQAARWDVQVTGGPSYSRLSNNTAVQINPDVVNNYNTNVTTRTGVLAGLGAGRTFNQIYGKPLDFSLDVMGYYSNFEQIKGIEHPFANVGAFDTLNYKFSAYGYALMLEPRLIYTAYCFQPFLLAGVGSAWNTLQSYSETPSDPSGSAAAAPVPFGNHTQNSFAYEVGAGVQKALPIKNTCGIQYFVSLDYRYMNFGSAQLSNFPAMTSNDHLQISNLYTQAIALTLKASV